MKIVKTTVDDDETSTTIDLFGDLPGLKAATKKKIAEEVGDFLIEETLVSVAQRKSPVSGEGTFKALSKGYKEYKNKEVGHTDANLELTGTMLDSLEYKVTDEGIALGVFGDRARAADGHNNLSGDSHIPQRRFLPDVGQNYKKQITKEVERIVADALSEDLASRDLKKILKDAESKSQLYESLGSIFGPMSRSELRIAVFRNEDIYDLLNDLGKIDLL